MRSCIVQNWSHRLRMLAAVGLCAAAVACSGGDDQAVVGDVVSLDSGTPDGLLTVDGEQVDGVSADASSGDGTAGDKDGALADTGPADAGPCTGAIGCPCKTDGECDTGTCVGEGGSAVCGTDCQSGCDDKNPCTADLCEAATSTTSEATCKHTPSNDGGACDDGNPCSGDGACAAGACAAGKAKDCGDDNPCTTDYCDNEGKCQNDNVAKKPCDDDDVCTVGDACAEGKCVGGTAQICDDSNPCTTDACDPKTGCESKDADGKACDDGDACTGDKAGGDACSKGACKPGTTTSCDDGNPCTVDGCSSDKGCTYSQQSGAPCSDGDVCTVGDVCGDKGCTSGKKQPCNDGNPCTTTACDKVKGCTSADNTKDCDDGNACTSGDACKGGVCLPGALTACDDGNPCTTDSCDPGGDGAKGGCVNKAADGGACVPQGDSCAVTGVCAAGACKKVSVTGCDDGNPCTSDACDKATGNCVYKPGKTGVVCDDGNVCTKSDVCGQAGCKGVARGCDDGNACTTDACDPTTKGGCVNTASDGAACNDGNLCTTNDKCDKGSCAAGKKLSCDDGNPCTDDSCDAKKGCNNKPNTNPCNDNNGCTSNDKCGIGAGGVAVCTPGTAKTCSDGKHCTKDICDPKADGGKGGCISKPDNGLGCDDGNVCTEGDICKDGACSSGPAQLCNDDNICTKDACDPKKGCVTSAVPGKCNDGDICSVGDTCSNGKCKPGKVTVCNDNNACTSDSCHYLKGCVYAALTGACNDGDACTSADQCKAGKCAGTKPTVCNDGNVCTNDSCDKIKGCLVAPNSKLCDDNNVCSIGDKCSGGTCKAGLKAKVCTDGKVCTADECDKVKGCQFPANSAECTDGNACTKNDQCDKFKCISGPKLSCDDHNLCTDDSCNVKTGCIHKPNSHPAFKSFSDKTTSQTGLWALTATNNKVKWKFKGSYYEMLGSLNAQQRMSLKPIIDLSCAVAPRLYYEERYYNGNQQVQVSFDGKVWTTIQSRSSASDYVWREREVDLSGYVGKKIYLRFSTSPWNSTFWWHLRRFEIREKKPLPKLVPWGSATSCADVQFEGPLFKCVKDGAGYQLQSKGVKATPPAYVHANTARYHLRFDRSKVKLPRLVIEERHRHGSLVVSVRRKGVIGWQSVWQRVGNTADYVWRRHNIDLGHIPGDVWEIRISTNYGNHDTWMDIRGVKFTTTPPDLSPIKAPYKWTKCNNIFLEGDAWKPCDPTGKVYDYRYELGTTTGSKITYNAYHYGKSLRRIDLSGLKNPIGRFYERHYRGYLYLQVSLDGVQWVTVAGHTYHGSDYVWREYVADLSAYKNKVIWVRLAARPTYSSSVWGEIKNLEIAEAPAAWPVVKWGAQTFNCSHWGFEGDSWTCDAKSGLKQQGNDVTPSPNGYYQGAVYKRTFDMTGVSNAVVRFERLSQYGELRFEVRKFGGGWQTLWTKSNHIDPIWRPVEVDLSGYVGQKIEMRFNGRPIYKATQPQHQQVRNFTLGTKITLPTVKFGADLPCNYWRVQGPAWKCDPNKAKWTWKSKLEKNDGTQNYYHHTELRRWIDLAGTKQPQIYYDRASYGTQYFYFQVTLDGAKWTTISGHYSLPSNTFYRTYRYDLTPFAGKKIRIRMMMRPYSSSYWTQTHNFSFRELDKVVSMKVGAAIKPADMAAEGSWKYDTTTATWSSDHTYKNYYQALRLKKTVDMSAAKKPELRFDSMAVYGRQRVQVSLDGVQWSDAWYQDNHSKVGADFEPVVVDLSSWAGQKTVHIRLWYYPYSYSTGYWKVRNLVIGEHTSLPIVKAPLNLGASHMKTLGLWAYDSKTGIYSLNNPKHKDIVTTMNGYHKLWPKVRVDISGLSTPTLTFEAQRYGSTVYIDVSVDEGKSWQSLSITDPVSSAFWGYMSVDLGAYKGHKGLLIRPSGRPGHSTYWWQVRNFRVANKFVFPVVNANTVATPSKWKSETGWYPNAAGGYIERKVDAVGQYTTSYLQVAYNLKTHNKPKLRFEETGKSPTRYVQVSDDGIIWQQFSVPGGVGTTWTKKEIDISSFGGSPTVYVRIRCHIAVKDRYWRVRKLTISPK
ncbi:MAG: hypothetical protein KC502_01680 [Myxococcales bacterium]|nr:hypothetical protein [Myxococcales bacterium]